MTTIKARPHYAPTPGHDGNISTEEHLLSHFMQGIMQQLQQLGKTRTSETYAAALSSFMRFRGGQDISLRKMDGNTMMLYEAWLKGKGLCLNTVSFYMRILRATYNLAAEQELTEQRHPFRHVYTGIRFFCICCFFLYKSILFQKVCLG